MKPKINKYKYYAFLESGADLLSLARKKKLFLQGGKIGNYLGQRLTPLISDGFETPKLEK